MRGIEFMIGLCAHGGLGVAGEKKFLEHLQSRIHATYKKSYMLVMAERTKEGWSNFFL